MQFSTANRSITIHLLSIMKLSALPKTTVCRTSIHGGNIKRNFSGSKSADGSKTIGFIGLGNMGFHMASNLFKNGYSLVIHDVNTTSVNKFKESFKSTTVASNPKEVASRTDHIITMLPSSPHVTQVFTSETGIFAAKPKPNSLFIDASTIDPNVSRDLAKKAKDMYKSSFLDAPVSGGVVGAEKGTLTFMVGGSAEEFERAKTILQFMGKNIVHCGGNGNGQVVKLCNNLALAIEMIGTPLCDLAHHSGISEAMNLGITMGMDPKVLAGIFNTSTSRCWSSDTYNPVPGVMEGGQFVVVLGSVFAVPSSRGYTGGFGVDLMAKDLSLAINAAHQAKVPLPLGGQALQLYNLISSHGNGGKDFSSVFEFLQKKDK